MNKYKPSTIAFVHNVCSNNNSKIFTHICDFKKVIFCKYHNQKQTQKHTKLNEKISIKKKTHPAVWTSRHTWPTEFSLTPPSVTERLHILAFPAAQFQY